MNECRYRQGEVTQNIPIGTAELLELLLDQEPNTDFSFALGGDTFMDLTNWKWRRSRDVMSLLHGRLVVLFRNDHVPEQVLNERIQHINQQEGGNARLLNISSLKSVSSTLLRSKQERKELEGMVTPEVLDYIVRNKLYGFADRSMRTRTNGTVVTLSNGS